MSTAAPKPLRTIQIDDRGPGRAAPAAISAGPRETVLAAALRAGIHFPNSCRVGGCGACKCRLTAGSVRELTETGYLLTADEIASGHILACQSVPRTDVRVEVALPEAPARVVTGRVAGQRRETHDITRLVVALDPPAGAAPGEPPLAYRPGQFAEVSIEGLPGVTRSYSFATPPGRTTPDGAPAIELLIRRVPGGQLSTLVNDTDLRGRAVRLAGPAGDFWLRPSDAPLLFVAGGSGLAPILAILHDAAAAGVARPATVLFGARAARDLYALDELAAIGARWGAPFRVIPVLSDEEPGSAWAGARGLVTDHLEDALAPGAHAYLCGPPAMIDRAIAALAALGVPAAHLHADRFTTRADAAGPATARAAAGPIAAGSSGPAAGAARARAGVLHYLKFFLFHAVGLAALAMLIAGGQTLVWGLLGILAFYIVGDAIAGDDTSTPAFARPRILTVQLWLALPLLALIAFAAVWGLSAGDPLGFGAWIARWTGYDALAARAATSWTGHLAAIVLTGLMIGMVGTITAHELTHRTWDPISLAIGRWLLAFSFDTGFAIEHVYGHHRYVATRTDPATAPRGRSVYAHVIASTIKGNISAWAIECERLARKRLPRYSWHNAVIRGHLMSVALVAAAGLLGGLAGAAGLLAAALWGKALLEIVNYMEHYGIVRDPATPVAPRHSWNTNRRISSWSMFNLTRHSHHHAQGEVPYQDLRPYPDAPMMLNGYLTTLLIAMVPPLWHRWMTPRVLAWDRDFATEEERALAREANARSGRAAFERAAGGRGRPRPGLAAARARRPAPGGRAEIPAQRQSPIDAARLR